ncbi:hypothetical protein [Afipia felis]|uniref:Uncharacterized protein n=2 Tax=Afipia felis TaxID=1035 RepID=A0A380W8P9_AFIFE|nr:hypothetical protein [Afipia felis]EKS28243.1 hypothetical protein HMPREF9697_00771 [Afipia felis ATCC 53690]SUU76953.1 Uncharacterised protein [Afipia felis]SUU85019.1 Uncharacterised protein [Afipia felis]
MNKRSSVNKQLSSQDAEEREPDIVSVFVRLNHGEITEDQADEELRDIRRRKSRGFFRFIESLSN